MDNWIASILLLLGAGLVWITAKWGDKMQKAVEERWKNEDARE
jgi:hypothetical protein